MAGATGIGGVFLRAKDPQAFGVWSCRDVGIGVESRADWDGDGRYGHFARTCDLDGNPAELREPPASA